MYFWRLEKLKTEMAARPLSEREALPYLVVFVALSSAVAYIPQTSHNLWDGFGAVWSVLLAAVGTVIFTGRTAVRPVSTFCSDTSLSAGLSSSVGLRFSFSSLSRFTALGGNGGRYREHALV